MKNDLKKDIFVTRQPIFDRFQNVYAYQLLFRSAFDTYFNQTSYPENDSTGKLLDHFSKTGLAELKRKKKALISITPKSLFNVSVHTVPKEEIIVGLPETIVPDMPAITYCKRLVGHGYTLAMDSFVLQEKYQRLVPFADIIKIDFKTLNKSTWKPIFQNFANKRSKFLAENVDTHEEFADAVDAGFTFFQGHFYHQPILITGLDLPSAKQNLLLIMKELTDPQFNVDHVEQIMKRDVSLSYQLLRFVNSAAFGFYKNVHSIRHAINMIGFDEFKKWLSVIILAQMGMDKPDEIMIQSIIRAKFCESLCQHTSRYKQKSEAFLTGMFSMIDSLLGLEMIEILAYLPLADEIKAALLGEENFLTGIFDLVKEYEKAHWASVENKAESLAIPISTLPSLYFDAVDWANHFERI